ncbi:hypothetical protein Tco_1419223 [Tanacetum coccineum]
MRFIPKHETVQKYGAILPDTLTNQAMKESEAYKTYYDLAIGKISWKSSDEDDDDEVSMSKDDDDNADDQDDDDQDDDNEQTESDNDGDDFVHPKFSTHDEEERQDEEDKDEEYSSQRVHTPSHTKSTDDEAYDEVTQGGNNEEEKLDEEEPNEEEEVDEMYRDVNINLERRDIEMTDAPETNVQATQVIEDTHVIMTTVTLEVQQQSSSVSSGFISQMLNPNQDTGIDSILNQNTQSHTPVDVPVSAAEIPPSSATTLPRPPIPLIQHLQQTPVFTSTTVPSTSLQNLPTFASLFKFKDRVKSLEKDFSEFKQTSQFAEAVSSIPGIVDNYLASKLKDAVDVTVQLKRRDDQDEDDEPSAGSKRGSKRRRARKEPKSTSASKDKTSKSTGSSKEGSKSSKSAQEQVHTDKDLEEPTHQEFETVNRESARDVYSRHRIIAITKLKIVEWQNYKHLDWITIRRDDDKLISLLRNVKLWVLNCECLQEALSSQRSVEDLQLGVKSYQKKLNLIRPDTYRSDLKRLPTYSAYPNPRGFIYQNKDKKNTLMRIDELYKFSDGTINDVRTALDDILKRIRMKYLPQTYWKKVDKDRARAIIQAIDKMLKNRRIMRSLEFFFGGRPYEGDFWLPQRTI